MPENAVAPATFAGASNRSMGDLGFRISETSGVSFRDLYIPGSVIALALGSWLVLGLRQDWVVTV